MTEPKWASHPNAALRLRLAEYLGRGWTIEQLETGSALVTRPKQWTRPGRVLINPLYLLFFGRNDRQDRMRLEVASQGQIIESRA